MSVLISMFGLRIKTNKNTLFSFLSYNTEGRAELLHPKSTTSPSQYGAGTLPIGGAGNVAGAGM